jgi:hypothetical protein
MKSDSPSDTTGGAPPGGGEELSGSLFLGDWSTPGSEVPGFGIESPTSVAQAAETLTGAPVTIEHTGTYEAAADLDRRDGDVSGASMHAYLTGSADPARRPVGTVLYAEGTKALIRIKPEAQRVAQLIESGMLDLSLTHLESSGERGSEVKSLELSLVTKPARAGARVLQQYKGTPIVGLKQKIVMSSAAAEAAAPAVPMETSTETPAPRYDAAVANAGSELGPLARRPRARLAGPGRRQQPRRHRHGVRVVRRYHRNHCRCPSATLTRVF